jgi:hypothetical protein
MMTILGKFSKVLRKKEKKGCRNRKKNKLGSNGKGS